MLGKPLGAGHWPQHLQPLCVVSAPSLRGDLEALYHGLLACHPAALLLLCSQEEVSASGQPPAMWALRSWACFSAHALFLVHMIALAAVLGAWTASSQAQLCAAIGIKAAWTL